MLCWHLKQISCMNLISPYDWLKPNWEVIFVCASTIIFSLLNVVSGLRYINWAFPSKKGKWKIISVWYCIVSITSCRSDMLWKFLFFFVFFELAGIIEKGGITVRKHRVYHAGDLYHLGILRPKFFCIFMWRLDIKIRKHRSLDHIFFFQNCPLTVYYYGSFPRMPKCEVEHAYSRNTDWSM